MGPRQLAQEGKTPGPEAPSTRDLHFGTRAINSIRTSSHRGWELTHRTKDTETSLMFSHVTSTD